MFRNLYNKVVQFLKKQLYKFDMSNVKKVLIIAPHPDDESIGMGGFLEKYAEKCEILLLTNGAFGNPELGKEKTIEVRRQEFEEVMEHLGVKKYYMLGIADKEAKKHLSVLKPYLTNEYDYIFIPSRDDIHQDHGCIYKYVNKIVKRRRLKGIIVEYEVWSPLRNPNYFLDISDCFKEKEITIQKYVSQIRRTQYDWGSLGLNMYRGMMSGYRYAEAYYINKRWISKVLDKMKKFKDKLEK